jgi:hypothetical protein
MRQFDLEATRPLLSPFFRVKFLYGYGLRLCQVMPNNKYHLEGLKSLRLILG